MKFPILSLLVAFAAPLTAGQLAPSQISPDAKWLVHADFDAMRDSRTGQAFFSLMEADHGEQLRSLSTFFALQPLNQLHGITLYGDGAPEHAVALIDGKFDRKLLEELVKTAKDYAGLTHEGYVVHSWLDKGVKQHAAFASDDLLIFSHQEEDLEKALDVLKTPPPAQTGTFLTAEDGHPLVVARARISEMQLPGDLTRLVRMAKTLRLATLEEGDRFVLKAGAETASSDDADRLRRMLDGVIAFAQIRDARLEGLDLRADLDAVTHSPLFTAALSLPVNDWITVMQKAAEKSAMKKNP